MQVRALSGRVPPARQSFSTRRTGYNYRTLEFGNGTVPATSNGTIAAITNAAILRLPSKLMEPRALAARTSTPSRSQILPTLALRIPFRSQFWTPSEGSFQWQGYGLGARRGPLGAWSLLAGHVQVQSGQSNSPLKIFHVSTGDDYTLSKWMSLRSDAACAAQPTFYDTNEPEVTHKPIAAVPCHECEVLPLTVDTVDTHCPMTYTGRVRNDAMPASGQRLWILAN
jgi:hypothetical protein